MVRHAIVAIILAFGISAGPARACDLKTCNAAVDVAIERVAPFIFSDISPTAGDATLVLRLTTMTTNAWFDATAPYHPTAVGVYSRFQRQAPPVDNEPLNIALLYASYEVFNSLLPARAAVWREMLESVGLDPDADRSDLTTPIGIGAAAGAAVVEGRVRDGMNQLGDEIGRGFNPTPFADYTAYKPVNTAYKLRNKRRWQPDIQRQGIGLYKVQQFVTPQYALVEPYAGFDPADFEVPAPRNSRGSRAYKEQADVVLFESASLDDEKKIKAELFDNKIASLGTSAIQHALRAGLSLMDFIHLDFLTNMAAFDAGIVIWREKRKHDAVRPFSAIRRIYGDDVVQAWGGPYQGTTTLPASEWVSYLEEADHPEYPSASTCFCRAHTQAARSFLGSDDLLYTVEFPAGSSRIEPGAVPADDLVVDYPTWTEFAEDCGTSRVWAGVHFEEAVEASRDICDAFGDMAYDYLSELIDGTAPLRGPSVGAPLSTLPDGDDDHDDDD